MMESAIILAGGKSVRMGRNKALLDFDGETLIERVYRTLKEDFQEVFVSANDPETYEFLGAPVIKDVFTAVGSLAGLHAGLLASQADSCFFAACDMPFVNIELVKYLSRFSDEYDLVIPMSRNGLEPLHAFYSQRCLPYVEAQLKEGNPKIIDFYHLVKMREVTVEEMSEFDPGELSYLNINTEEEYERAMGMISERKIN